MTLQLIFHPKYHPLPPPKLGGGSEGEVHARSQSRGFTIVELLIYMGLLSGLLVILGNVLSQVIDVQLESQAVSAVEQDGRFILARLNYDLHRAASVSSPATAGQTTSSLVTNVGTYTLYGDNLQLGGQNLNSFDSSITNFSVTRLGPAGVFPSFQVNLNLQGRATPLSGAPKTKTYITTITLRNE